MQLFDLLAFSGSPAVRLGNRLLTGKAAFKRIMMAPVLDAQAEKLGW